MKTKLALALAALVAASSPAPALAQVGKFTIVNNTDIPFSQVMVRRFGGQQWLPLTVTPVPVASAGGRSAVDSAIRTVRSIFRRRFRTDERSSGRG